MSIEQLQFASFLGASLCYADHRMNILLDKKPKCPCKPQVAGAGYDSLVCTDFST